MALQTYGTEVVCFDIRFFFAVFFFFFSETICFLVDIEDSYVSTSHQN